MTGKMPLSRARITAMPMIFPGIGCDQQYLPDALKDVRYYAFGDNRTEQAARAYWAKIKGEEKL